jgi:hypothetical protein
MIRMMAYKGMPTACPLHGGGVIESPDREVLVGGDANFASVTGDVCNCPGAPNTVMAGATDILVKGLPVSGWMHVTAHNPGPPDAPTAAVMWGSTGVIMGGGMTVGPVAAATAACMFLAEGRQGKSPTQSGQNCGVESMRQMINAKRRRDGEKELSEDQLLDETLRHGDSYVTIDPNDVWDTTLIEKDNELEPYRQRKAEAHKAFEGSKGVFSTGDQKLLDAQRKADREYDEACTRLIPVDKRSGAPLGDEHDLHRLADEARVRQKQRQEAAAATPDFKDKNRLQAGGTLYEQQKRVLNRHGIEVDPHEQDSRDPAKMKELEEAVIRGKGVIVGVKASTMWGDDNAKGDHAVTVTAVEYDADGKVSGYVTNDTMKGCGRRVSAETMHSALIPGNKATITRDPVW